MRETQDYTSTSLPPSPSKKQIIWIVGPGLQGFFLSTNTHGFPQQTPCYKEGMFCLGSDKDTTIFLFYDMIILI